MLSVIITCIRLHKLEMQLSVTFKIKKVRYSWGYMHAITKRYSRHAIEERHLLIILLIEKSE